MLTFCVKEKNSILLRYVMLQLQNEVSYSVSE